MSPSPFIVEWTTRLAGERSTRGRALDVAMGRGRHTPVLARAGWRTFGVDIRFHSVSDGVAAAAAQALSVAAWCADLTAHPLPAARFDLIVVTRYLERNLCSAIRDA